jgi:hypothetical protein
MAIGTSIFLIAAGAILRYAVTVDVDWIELDTVGVILMVAGALGLVASLVFVFAMGDRDRYPPPRDRY